MHWAYDSGQRQKHKLMLIIKYLFAGPGYGPRRLSDFGSKEGSTRMNAQLSNDYDT